MATAGNRERGKSVSAVGEFRTRVRAVFSLLLAAVAAIAMCATGAVLATGTAGAAGGAPTITNGTPNPQ